MSTAGRRKTGPLTNRQREILEALVAGKTQKELAAQLEFSETYISNEVTIAVAKMQSRTTAAAVARYRCYKTYLNVSALLLERGIVPVPMDAAEAHCNHVIEDMAKLMRQRAERLLPS